MSPGTQPKIVQGLWDLVTSHGLVKEQRGGALVNGTGDGVLIAFPTLKRAARYNEVVELAKDLAKGMAKAKSPAGLRIGLHAGSFVQLKVAKGRAEVVGTTVNQCARITPIGDAGQITVSEEFIHAWRGAEQVTTTHFHPPLSDPNPYTVFVKHDEEMHVRLYTGGRNIVVPGRLRQLQVVVDRITEQLKFIETTLTSALHALDQRLTRERLSTRVSIVTPRSIDGEQYLCPTRFRFHHAGGDFLKPGSTCYNLRKAEGPLALCYNNRRRIAVKGLPEPTKFFEEYVAALSKFGLVRKTIIGWQRKSRALLAFPFGLFSFAEHDPDGVICIDMSDPLDHLTGSKLERIILAGLQREVHPLLSAFWKLRMLT